VQNCSLSDVKASRLFVATRCTAVRCNARTIMIVRNSAIRVCDGGSTQSSELAGVSTQQAVMGFWGDCSALCLCCLQRSPMVSCDMIERLKLDEACARQGGLPRCA